MPPGQESNKGHHVIHANEKMRNISSQLTLLATDLPVLMMHENFLDDGVSGCSRPLATTWNRNLGIQWMTALFKQRRGKRSSCMDR